MTMVMQSTSSYETVKVHTVYEFAICTSPIIYLVSPPKILSNLCFSFLLGITVVLREIEDNMLMRTFVGQRRFIIGYVQIANKTRKIWIQFYSQF